MAGKIEEMTETLELIEPTESLRYEYLDCIFELRSFGEKYDHEACKNFPMFVRRLRSQSSGEELPVEHVPESTYWLIAEGRVIGRCHLRHRLSDRLRDWGGHIGICIRPSMRRKGYGTRLLSLALRKARKLGLDCALLTCDKDDAGTAKVIRRNGGKLDSEGPSKRGNCTALWFWIDLSDIPIDESEPSNAASSAVK